MIGQGIGVRHLLPKAIETLKENPFAEGDFFEGDLLIAVARLPADDLPADKISYEALAAICRAALASDSPELSRSDRTMVSEFLHRLPDRPRR